MIYAGMTAQGVECVANARARYDGEKRNPWDEPECGHHYARAMSAWSALLAISGFRYHGGEHAVTIKAPRRTPLLLQHRYRMGHVPGDGRGRDAARRSRHVGMPHAHGERQEVHARMPTVKEGEDLRL